MKGGLLLNVIIIKGSSIFKVLATKSKSLFVWGNSLLFLNFGLNIFNWVWSFYIIKNYCFSCRYFDEDLHASSDSHDHIYGGFVLNVVVRKGSSIFKVLVRKNKSLLVWGDTFFVLNLGLYVLDGIRSFHVKSDRFSSQGFDEDLHASSESQDQMKGGFLLNVIVRKCSSIL